MINANAAQITGANLLDHSLVMTYDDGPGPNTLPIAEYLSGMGIEATFFVVGKFAEKQPKVLAQLVKLGHRLGNHTWTHYKEEGGLAKQLADGGDIVKELQQTADLLGAAAKPIPFRAPYGECPPAVAHALSADAKLNADHVGHIHWDIHWADWAGWRDGVDPTVVATCFRVAARTMKKGIVLLHDYTADNDVIARANRGPELTRALIPTPIADGFRFVPLADALT